MTISLYDGASWRKANNIYINVNGAADWRKAKAVWVYDGASWRKGYSSTYTIEGYADWTGSYIFDSTSDTSGYLKSTNPQYVYQGKYDSYYYRNVMNFDTVMGKARGLNIIKAELWIKNLHSYYGSGLNTYITGGWASPSTRPSSYPLDRFGGTRYSNNENWAKNGPARYITLNSTCIDDIKNNRIDSLHCNAVAGWSLTDYGYFQGTGGGSDTPYLKLTISY